MQAMKSELGDFVVQLSARSLSILKLELSLYVLIWFATL